MFKSDAMQLHADERGPTPVLSANALAPSVYEPASMHAPLEASPAT